eukprot:CAMPEP_0182480780 /NCGR_PEP_ID=MMETSP1319-20130603/36320_1 /TAXON_ID=172717 /ORGANISM="Bolidomonas pacifica, Strain RCC208" /LENGTH=31 /DNA_ID= /DNA_START= /DNA_END= /DNA_ORIENTATION=
MKPPSLGKIMGGMVYPSCLTAKSNSDTSTPF